LWGSIHMYKLEKWKDGTCSNSCEKQNEIGKLESWKNGSLQKHDIVPFSGTCHPLIFADNGKMECGKNQWYPIKLDF